MKLPAYTHPLYTDALSHEARFPRLRYRMVAQAVSAEPSVELRTAPLASRSELLWAHCPQYVDSFLQGSLPAEARRRIGLTPWTSAIQERTLRIMGGSLAALDAALTETGVASNLAGGTHHAHRGFGSGYCVFNDIALVVARARLRYGLKRVLVIDLDVHQGDGTATLFASDPDTYTLSVHCGPNFPFRKARSRRDVSLPAGSSDGPYLAAVAHHLGRSLDASDPELVVYQAGVDPLKTDKLGRLSLSPTGLARRDRLVMEDTAARRIPTVVLMGGGYAEPLEDSVQAHAQVVRTAAQHVFRPLSSRPAQAT